MADRRRCGPELVTYPYKESVIVQVEEIEKQLDLITKALKIALQLGIGIGALIILIYCGRVGYYPLGLTIGDGLVFVAVALSFGFSYSIIVFFLFCTAVVLTTFVKAVKFVVAHAHKMGLKIKGISLKGESTEFHLPTSDQSGIAVIGIIGVVFIILIFFADFELFVGLIFSVVLMALCYWLLNSVNENKNDSEAQQKSKKKVGLVFMVSIYLIPLVVGHFLGNVLDQTMRLIGIRNENAVVQFQKDYKSFVDSTLNTKGNDLYKAKVLLSGFGTSSVLEIEGRVFIVPNTQFFLRSH